MSEPHGRPAPPDRPYDYFATPERMYQPKPTRTVRFWVMPVLVTLVLLAATAAVYLGGVLRPMSNLRHFPVAVVNEDAGPTGAQVVKGMLATFDHDAYDVRVLAQDEAKKQLQTAQIYGVAVIPPNFSSKLQAYAKSTLTPGRIERAVVIVSTNPRAGTMGSSIAGQTLQRAVSQIDQRVGQRLSQEVAEQAGRPPESGAVALMLAHPVEVKSTIHDALPDGTANGLSAFYFTLLLLIAGFIGAVVLDRLVRTALDSDTEPPSGVSGFRRLLIAWAMVLALALSTSGAFLLIAQQAGMPVSNGFTLWLFGALSITAVGVTSVSLIALMGSAGVLIGVFLFIILGLPAAGAIVPLQATPAWFEGLATFAPMHQAFVGARSLLYLNGAGGSGLSQSVAWTVGGLLAGLLLGAVTARAHDRPFRLPGRRRTSEDVVTPQDATTPA